MEGKGSKIEVMTENYDALGRPVLGSVESKLLVFNRLLRAATVNIPHLEEDHWNGPLGDAALIALELKNQGYDVDFLLRRVVLSEHLIIAAQEQELGHRADLKQLKVELRRELGLTSWVG